MRTPPNLPLQSAALAGGDIAYLDHGAGTPVILIHGSLCDCRYWTPQMAPLGRGHRVLAPSLKRYWPEQWDGAGAGFSLDEHTGQVLDFIEQVAGEPAHLLGHSRGGRVALEAALRRPDLVRTLTLADPGVPVPDQADQRGDFRQQALQRIQAGDTDEGLALFIDAVTGPDTWRRMVPWFKDMVRDNATTLLGQSRETPRPVDEDALRALGMPVLLIGGALSPQPYPAAIAWLEDTLPYATSEMIAGSSHGMNLGNPRAFNQAVADFLG
ncbi:alpha/beta fold hydrolase [Bordetella genomosp. 13]|uniref:alpha/beta fold hydrolase n=1 Tax=Bordetella genomosp. 13 TaxID=463040 RepID=UPI0011A96C9D|nr:alpha/beta hydrolase [Bordetella genomosp. 13]